MWQKRMSNAAKVAVTIIGLVLVARQIEWTAVSQTLAHTQWNWLLFGFALVNASLILRACRWLLLLRALHLPLSLWRLVELYFVGSFFNAFLPSGFGGDVVRIVEITQEVDLDVATGTVMLDRLSGLIMLFVMALLWLPFHPGIVAPGLSGLIVGGTAVSLLGLTLLLQHSLLLHLGRWLPGPLSPSGHGLLARVLKAVQACGPKAVGAALLVSILFNLMLTGWWAATGAALHLNIPFSYYLFAVPILSIALLAPSIGGLGVRELIAPTLFAAAGLSGEQAVSLSLLVFLLERSSGVFGALIYLWRITQKPISQERF